ncbi:hypothetical protein CVT25_001264 [Psilocybe cyanescens]|uniref:Uncharacterized protein n=1 Tax=Psilocybe cyanescens TaxID=93625 RepID=A0A409XAX5_PSICY|nr:hypothetical protein CVT25_001264 [Psilocybe cyanescens]
MESRNIMTNPNRNAFASQPHRNPYHNAATYYPSGSNGLNPSLASNAYPHPQAPVVPTQSLNPNPVAGSRPGARGAHHASTTSYRYGGHYNDMQGSHAPPGPYPSSRTSPCPYPYLYTYYPNSNMTAPSPYQVNASRHKYPGQAAQGHFSSLPRGPPVSSHTVSPSDPSYYIPRRSPTPPPSPPRQWVEINPTHTASHQVKHDRQSRRPGGSSGGHHRHPAPSSADHPRSHSRSSSTHSWRSISPSVEETGCQPTAGASKFGHGPEMKEERKQKRSARPLKSILRNCHAPKPDPTPKSFPSSSRSGPNVKDAQTEQIDKLTAKLTEIIGNQNTTENIGRDRTHSNSLEFSKRKGKGKERASDVGDESENDGWKSGSRTPELSDWGTISPEKVFVIPSASSSGSKGKGKVSAESMQQHWDGSGRLKDDHRGIDTDGRHDITSEQDREGTLTLSREGRGSTRSHIPRPATPYGKGHLPGDTPVVYTVEARTLRIGSGSGEVMNSYGKHKLSAYALGLTSRR